MTLTRTESRKDGVLPLEYPLTQLSLTDYLAAGAVSELVIRACDDGTWRLEASLSWRSGAGVLMAARGDQRRFRSLDTVARFLTSLGIKKTFVRLELLP